MATPESATLCGLPAASSVTVSVPLRGPVAVGENVIVTLQLAPAASVAGASGHAVLCAKSAAFAPPSAIELIVSGAFPVFVIFAVCCEVVPTLVVGSCSGLGDRPTAGAMGAVAVPLRKMLTLTGETLSENWRMADFAPVLRGANATSAVQLAPAGRVGALKHVVA